MCEILRSAEKTPISIGGQNFEYMRTEKVFYVDKTHFIKEWWEEKDVVTLITRPRRFGKTLNLSMMECFFSAGYAGRDDLFEGLSIWEDESYRKLQGTFPVISISFAGVKAKSFQGARDDPARGKHIYRLKLTNHEVRLMFQDMIAAWFPEDETSYQNFKEAFLTGDLDYMNQYMNETAAEVFSSFDIGWKFPEKTHPERFYHGFVLGLIVDLAGRYQIRSNRESGLGRYDVMSEPLHQEDDAIVIEFKVFSKQKDRTLENAVENALEQIKKKKYDTELIARGIHENRIRHYGFAFDGKKILIGEADVCSPRNRR